MSTLTEEEKELMTAIPNRGIIHDDAMNLIAIIDRLVAENEELRKKLTALVEAAVEADDKYLNANTPEEMDIAMFNLNKAVKEAKG